MDMKVKATQLNEKALLVKLTMRRANLSRRDEVAETLIQNQLGDDSLVVNSKLFRDKLNPVNRMVSMVSELYTYHKSVTLPYADKGPRILPNAMYFEYTKAMKERMAEIDAKLNGVMRDWDLHVVADVAWRSKTATTQRASTLDYPTAEQFRERMGFELRFLPLPNESHFLFDMSDEDKAGFQASMRDVERIARNDAIRRMLEPTQHLMQKLALEIGSPGSVFRDSAIQNVIDGIELARKLNVDESPDIKEVIDEVARAVAKMNGAKEHVRENVDVRAKAAKRLAELNAKMAGLMGS